MRRGSEEGRVEPSHSIQERGNEGDGSEIRLLHGNKRLNHTRDEGAERREGSKTIKKSLTAYRRGIENGKDREVRFHMETKKQTH